MRAYTQLTKEMEAVEIENELLTTEKGYQERSASKSIGLDRSLKLYSINLS